MSLATATPVLEVQDLRTYLQRAGRTVKAVDGVSFDVMPGEVIGLVGESGCGKSMTALSLLRLTPEPQSRIVSGKVLFHGEDLLEKSEQELCAIRGDRISMIFQDPMTSLNPVLSIGRQVGEMYRVHGSANRAGALRRSVEMLTRVHIPSPEARLKSYPHQLSGGMRQRVMISMALSQEPDVIIADEPTTALDVTVQAQILRLLREIKERRRTAIILITHDLGVVAQMCDRVAVMYAGKIVELADVQTVFRNPQHPYTRGLLNSVIRLGRTERELLPIEGQPPDLSDLPEGCAFAARCPLATPDCAVAPPLKELGDGHHARCHYAKEVVYA